MEKKYNVVFVYSQNLYSGLYSYEDITLLSHNYFDDDDGDNNYINVLDDYGRTYRINRNNIEYLTDKEKEKRLKKLNKKK